MNGVDGQSIGLPTPIATAIAPAMPAAGLQAKSMKAAKDFESVLLHKLMEEMQRTVGRSGLLDDGTSDQVQGIFWMEMAQEISRQGGIGLWKQIYRQMNVPEDAGKTVEQLR